MLNSTKNKGGNAIAPKTSEVSHQETFTPIEVSIFPKQGKKIPQSLAEMKCWTPATAEGNAPLSHNGTGTLKETYAGNLSSYATAKKRLKTCRKEEIKKIVFVARTPEEYTLAISQGVTPFRFKDFGDHKQATPQQPLLVEADAPTDTQDTSDVQGMPAPPSTEDIRAKIKAARHSDEKQEKSPETESEESPLPMDAQLAKKSLNLTRTEVKEDGSVQAIMACCVCDEAAEILTKYKPRNILNDDFLTPIAEWIIEYYQEFKKAPRGDIEAIYLQKKPFIESEATVELIEKTLRVLNEKYMSDTENHESEEYLTKITRNYFTKRTIEMATEDAQALISVGKIEEATKILSKMQLEIEGHGKNTTLKNAFQEALKYDLGAIVKADAPPPIEYFFSNNLPRREVAVFVGDGGVGKSKLGLQLAVSCASSLNAVKGIFPAPPQGKAFVFSAEDSREQTNIRIWQICNYFMQEQKAYADSIYKQISENLIIMPSGAYPKTLIEIVQGRATETSAAHMLRDGLKSIQNLQMIVLDTFSKTTNGESNANMLADAYVNYGQALAHETGATIFIMHHISKAASANSESQLAQNAGRGSNSLVNSARWQSNLASVDDKIINSYGLEDSKNYVLIANSKNNYAQKADTKILRFDDGVLILERSKVDIKSGETKKQDVDEITVNHILEYIENNPTTTQAKMGKTVSELFEPWQAKIVIAKCLEHGQMETITKKNTNGKFTEYLRIVKSGSLPLTSQNPS